MKRMTEYRWGASAIAMGFALSLVAAPLVAQAQTAPPAPSASDRPPSDLRGGPTELPPESGVTPNDDAGGTTGMAPGAPVPDETRDPDSDLKDGPTDLPNATPQGGTMR